jgi:hypothetical protein
MVFFLDLIELRRFYLIVRVVVHGAAEFIRIVGFLGFA